MLQYHPPLSLSSGYLCTGLGKIPILQTLSSGSRRVQKGFGPESLESRRALDDTVAETLFHFDLMDAEILVHRLAAYVRSQMTKHYASGPFIVCHETVRSHFTRPVPLTCHTVFLFVVLVEKAASSWDSFLPGFLFLLSWRSRFQAEYAAIVGSGTDFKLLVVWIKILGITSARTTRRIGADSSGRAASPDLEFRVSTGAQSLCSGQPQSP